MPIACYVEIHIIACAYVNSSAAKLYIFGDNSFLARNDIPAAYGLFRLNFIIVTVIFDDDIILALVIKL